MLVIESCLRIRILAPMIRSLDEILMHEYYRMRFCPDPRRPRYVTCSSGLQSTLEQMVEQDKDNICDICASQPFGYSSENNSVGVRRPVN